MLGATIAALTVAAAAAPGAQAISGGELDGTRHPNVGLFAIEHDGIKEARCSGFYAGPHKTDPGTGVFVTAAHCLADVAALGFSGSDLTVTFDATVTIEWNTWATTATTWHPAFAYDTSAVEDYGVILLEDPVPGLSGVEFPAAGLLDDLAAGGALRPTTPFDNVGYGLIPHFKRGPARYELPAGRMLSSSKFLGLTKSYLKLLSNGDAGYGGACYGDSGGPVLRHNSNTAVAFHSGGDPLCRALDAPLRLDIPAARAFYGQYLGLP
ncbi:MAG: trypsin-like serine protease [Thermoleophilaceae bacterium]|nr:trypsin-like serine protease [Thermoleophilaceae bacterium]